MGGGRSRGRHPNERYSSFDYCFNYFQSFKKRNAIKDLGKKENLQQACFHMGFYLASWGMLRGSSFLLEKSARHFVDAIKVIASFDKTFWDIDVDTYSSGENVSLILENKQKMNYPAAS